MAPPKRDISHLELPWTLEDQKEMFRSIGRGDIVTFMLDAINSLESLVDPLLDEPLASFPARRHLGLIHDTYSIAIDNMPFYYVDILVIGHNEPDSDNKTGE